MTVRELITKLEEIENKELTVIGMGCDDCDDVIDVAIADWYDKENNKEQFCEIRLAGY